ncbi:aminotransferase class V-fold PLP-dependent enzyme [Holdemania massiliensis]|uniref:Cysteine desulfurase n=2 Tax=Holdemania massiliensis TaxID=1468449 RepID=A0A6N7SBU6_9FIRM|nr:SufS family cysteine desulfurase [Holdemania massiliensis]MSA72847.1 SufS family cysteine desulfurase [Holdemania massiliensis]MSA91112.1 SufS family cysteine desulfurase [Holdemania massiliensis]MSB79962.1 SufS family cysteine desulfurase [Holdemania massiliensis]MSC34883.1 SufS family cysteine desulfurase [Holdemania massiliensis]MSC41272.1 SufS family cysteine desulfurase [Holdemania massiliensis]
MFDVLKIRQDFPMLHHHTMQSHPLVYLDNAATTFKPQCVIDAVVRYYTDQTANVHRGDYEISYQVSEAYEKTREDVARFIHAQPKEIVFTAGASASLNLVAYGYGRKYLKAGDVILSTEAEHASNILPWFKVAEETGAQIEYIPLTEDGQLTLENFRQAMHESVKIVAVADITNVLGYVAPIEEMTRIAHERGAIVVCDGAQSVPHTPTDVQAWGVDFLAFSAHKMCGPTGVGVLYGKYELLQKTDPFMLGGGSNARFDMCGNILLKDAPYKFEAGTPNIEGVLGLQQAVRYLESIGMEQIQAYEHELKAYAIEKLKKLDNLILYNPTSPTGIIAFNVKDVFAQDAAGYLNSQGIAVRSGNHCAKILLNVLKTSETIRASLYFYNTKEDVDRFVQACSEITLENCVGLFF